MQLSIRKLAEYYQLTLQPTNSQTEYFGAYGQKMDAKYRAAFKFMLSEFKKKLATLPVKIIAENDMPWIEAIKNLTEMEQEFMQKNLIRSPYVPFLGRLQMIIETNDPNAVRQLSTSPEVREITKYSFELPKKTSKEITLYKRAKSYIEKKKEESGNITYIYSDKHIKARNKKKEKRIKTLAKSIKDLRKELKKDMKDEDKKNVALVISLIDETYERVGNPVSAGEDHFGVTTWRKKHVSFSGSSVKIKYKGKAGVDQEKIVTNSTIVKELKTICQNIKKNDELFPEVSANKVNEYLKPYKITAKDIRGFHANEEMKKALKKAKSKEKDVEKKRKEEFKKALEETAKLVGHTPNTLKNQYLVPSIEVDYMKSGKTSQASLSIRDN